jgi:hypothetical protein
MSETPPQATISISLSDLEALIRRVVRDAVHEEFARLAQRSRPAVAQDWDHEGPDDPAGDAELLDEALALVEQYRHDKSGWQDLEDFKADLKLAEQRGELPD